jgi:hypothetical protein
MLLKLYPPEKPRERHRSGPRGNANKAYLYNMGSPRVGGGYDGYTRLLVISPSLLTVHVALPFETPEFRGLLLRRLLIIPVSCQFKATDVNPRDGKISSFSRVSDVGRYLSGKLYPTDRWASFSVVFN